MRADVHDDENSGGQIFRKLCSKRLKRADAAFRRADDNEGEMRGRGFMRYKRYASQEVPLCRLLD